MDSYEVSLTPDAISDLENIYLYIAEKSGLPEVAWAYCSVWKKPAVSLKPCLCAANSATICAKGLRIVPIDKNAAAAFEVDEDKRTVTILNVFYGGRDYEAIMQDS